jgi:hypothetical protein
VCDEPGCVAVTAYCKHSNEMGFDHQGRSDLNVLYWVAHIPDRKPVLYIKGEKVNEKLFQNLSLQSGDVSEITSVVLPTTGF